MTQNPNLATRQWLKKKQIFDNEIATVLDGKGIKYPEQDFKNFSRNDWKKTEQALKNQLNQFSGKDTQKKSNYNKKLVKLEGFWREISGIKKQAGTGNSKKKSTKSNKNKPLKSKEESQRLIEGATELKKWMRSVQSIWAIELFEELALAGVTNKDDLNKIDSMNKFNEIRRKTVLRRKDDSTEQQNKLKKLINDFEKVWKQETGFKSNMQTKKTKNSKSQSKSSKPSGALEQAPKLVKWLRIHNCLADELVEVLVELEITTPEELSKLNSEKKQEKVEEKAKNLRTKRVKQLKPNKKMRDEILPNFFKSLKEIVNIDTSMQTEKTRNTKPKKQTVTQKTEIQKWLQSELNVGIEELNNGLTKRNVYTLSDFKEKFDQDSMFEFMKEVRIAVVVKEKDQEASKRKDKALIKVENEWRKMTGNQKTMGTGNNKN